MISDAHFIGWLVFGAIIVGHSATVWTGRVRPLGAVVMTGISIWCAFMGAFFLPTGAILLIGGNVQTLGIWMVESLIVFLPLLTLLLFVGVTTHGLRTLALRHQATEKPMRAVPVTVSAAH